MNSITISGEVTRVHNATLQSGKDVTNLGLKVSREAKDGRVFSSYFDVVKWGGAPGINEGDEVIVLGELAGKKHYKQDAEGKDIWTVEINATFGDILPVSTSPGTTPVVEPDPPLPFSGG